MLASPLSGTASCGFGYETKWIAATGNNKSVFLSVVRDEVQREVIVRLLKAR